MTFGPSAELGATVAREHRLGGSARFRASLPFHYVAILPALIATVSVILVPLAYSFGISFYHFVLTDPRNVRFDGLANYIHALSDPSFLNSLRVTFVYAFGTVALELVLGMAAAV